MEEGKGDLEDHLPTISRPHYEVVRWLAETFTCPICTWNYLARIRKNRGQEMPEQTWGFVFKRFLHWCKKSIGISCRRR